MEQLKKTDLLKHAKNEYLGAMLAAKVARRLHAMHPDDRPEPGGKVTSLALKLITEGKVDYEIGEPEPHAEDLTD
jgi:DNA-directed RNA polymerase subunit K/omega